MLISFGYKSNWQWNTENKSKRENHIKDLYCLQCKNITKNLEVRYCDNFDEEMDKENSMKTIKIRGYDVTGTEKIVLDIDNTISKGNKDFSWEILYEDDIIFCDNGERVYSITIDHKNKKVLADEYKTPEWFYLKVGDRVESILDGLKGTIIKEHGFLYYIVKLDNGKTKKIEGKMLRKIE